VANRVQSKISSADDDKIIKLNVNLGVILLKNLSEMEQIFIEFKNY
jgi:hypothetical protein